jgi:hypothetical protein
MQALAGSNRHWIAVGVIKNVYFPLVEKRCQTTLLIFVDSEGAAAMIRA